MLNNYSCIIVDDEPDAIDMLVDSISQLYKNIEIAGKYAYWEDALSALRETNCDLVFMDISLPGKNAIELLRLLPGLQCEIIFVTAHEQYALEAFSFSTSGYVLKPISDVALSVAINKALVRIQNKRLAQKELVPTLPVHDKIGIPDNNGINYVDTKDILYLETVNKCTKIVTSAAEYVSSYQLGKFKDHLGASSFFQVHRSYIINIRFILRYETSGTVIMTNKKKIPISRGIKNDFLNLFNSFH